MDEQKPNDFFEREIKEEIDEISSSSSQIMKQESVCSEPRNVVAINDVKMESNNELNDDHGSQMHLNHTLMEKPNQKVYNRRCSICSQLKPMKFIKEVFSIQDKLIIMIKLVLCGEYNLASAQSFVHEKKQKPICHAHFSEALNEIFRVLRIQNLKEVYSCSSELMQNLMITVNAVRPQPSAMGFCDTLNNFTTRNHHIFQMVKKKMKLGENAPNGLNERKIKHLISKKNLSEARYYCRCSVCSRKEIRKNMKDTTIENEKLIIMVGRILRGDSTFEEARSFIFLRRNCFICHVHFSDAIKEIFNALHIQNPNDICSCSVGLMQKLMITVNVIRPQLPASYFQEMLKQFVLRNESFIQMALLPMEVDEQAPIDLSENENKEEPGDFIGKVKEESSDD